MNTRILEVVYFDHFDLIVFMKGEVDQPRDLNLLA